MKKRTNGLRARTRDEIEGTAHRLRRELGIANQCTFDITNVVEFALPKLIPNFTFTVARDDDFGSGILALAREDPPEIAVRESVYHDAMKHEPQARWILAHEIGHIVLGHAKRAALLSDGDAYEDVADAEYQANVFAQFLLLPSELVEPFKSPSLVAERFLVSRSAAKARLKEVCRKRRSNIKGVSSELCPAISLRAMAACSQRYHQQPTQNWRPMIGKLTEGEMMKQRDLNGRHRDQNGEIRHKNGNICVDALRETYGTDFAKGYRGDTRLETHLERTSSAPLTEHLKK